MIEELNSILQRLRYELERELGISFVEDKDEALYGDMIQFAKKYQVDIGFLEREDYMPAIDDVRRVVRELPCCLEFASIVSKRQTIHTTYLPTTRVEPPPVGFECPVCYEGGFTYVCEIPCKHQFCDTCIHKWLRKSHQCPLCRTEILRSILDRILHGDMISNVVRSRAIQLIALGVSIISHLIIVHLSMTYAYRQYIQGELRHEDFVSMALSVVLASVLHIMGAVLFTHVA